MEEFDSAKSYLEYYLAKELTTLGNGVCVFTFGLSKEKSRIMSTEGFEVINIPHFVTIQGYHVPNLQGLAYILRFIKAKEPDVIHCQPLDSPLSLILFAFKSFYNYKIVGTIMTQLNLVFSPWGLKKKILFSMSKIVVDTFVAKRTEAVIAKTGELARVLSRSYRVPEKKFRIIPLGSDPEIFKFSSEERYRLRKKLGFSDTDVVLVYSGKLDSTKGLDVFLKAFALISINNDGVKLLIIGKGDAKFTEYLKQLVSDLGVGNKVVFQSWVEKTLIPSFYSASDIGVWPGLSSISIVDAASTGLPLVISRCPVETFAIENENGFSFEIGNVQELRRYLEILIRDDGLRKRMGQKSRQLVEQTLNWSSITGKYLTAYTSTLSGLQTK